MGNHNDIETEGAIKREFWFADWLKRAWPRTHDLIFNDNWVKVLSLLAGLGILAVIREFVIAVIKDDKTFLFYVNDVGHLVLLGASLAVFLPKLEAKKLVVPYGPHDPTGIAVKQFRHWFYGIVVLWVAFYFARLLADLPHEDIANANGQTLRHFAHILAPYVNVLSAIPLFGLYIVLAKRSFDEFFWGMGNRTWIAVVIVLTVWVVESWALTNTGETSKLVAGIANGLVVGGALALVVGRLDSRYIGLPIPVVSFLYLYALIQPLYPIVFKDNPPNQLMYPFVGLALIMKCTLILTLGMIIDNRRFHFYVTNLRWLDIHAATMIMQHDAVLQKFGVSRPMPPLFCFVHPRHNEAVLRFQTLDVKVELTILNAWIGVGWEIKDFEVESVRISNIEIPVKEVKLVNHGKLTVEKHQRHTFASLYITLGIKQSDLFNKLRHDNRIMGAIRRKRKTTRVNIVLKGIKAQVAILEKGSLQHIPTPIEEVDGADGLFFACIINLAKLSSA